MRILSWHTPLTPGEAVERIAARRTGLVQQLADAWTDHVTVSRIDERGIRLVLETPWNMSSRRLWVIEGRWTCVPDGTRMDGVLRCHGMEAPIVMTMALVFLIVAFSDRLLGFLNLFPVAWQPGVALAGCLLILVGGSWAWIRWSGRNPHPETLGLLDAFLRDTIQAERDVTRVDKPKR